MRRAFLLAPLVYAYGVYPLILSLAAHQKGRRAPVPKEGTHAALPTVSFVTPFYNEGAVIAKKARELRRLARRMGGDAWLVSDGSTDRSSEIVRKVSRINLIERPRGGKTAAIQEAARASRSEIVILSDANVSVSVETARAMVSAFADPAVGAVAAPLHPAEQGTEHLYWRFENRIKAWESASGLAVSCAGACMAVRRRSLEEIDYDGMLCEDLWLSLAIASRGHRVVFVDAQPAVEGDSGIEDVEFRRRARIMNGNLQVLRRLPEIWSDLSFRDRFGFLSHKACRWATPIFLLAFFLSSIRSVLIATMLVATFRPARYFLAMNLALLRGLIAAPRPRGTWIPERTDASLSARPGRSQNQGGG